MTDPLPRPRKSPDKGAEDAPDTGAPESPMGRFKAVARRLANVSRQEFEREEARYNAANASRRQNRPKK